MKKPDGLRLIDENGLRIDGRRYDQLRPLKISAHYLKRADGSAYMEWGGNRVLVAVYGPREAYPKHIQNPNRAIVRVKYNMAPFSVDERKRPGPDRRSVELSKVISQAFESVVFVENFPRAVIDVYIEILQADAGTRVAGLTAASVALADAGIPMKDLLVGISAGKVDGKVVLDLNKEEDNYGEADLPVAVIPRTGEIALIQMDGHLTMEEMDHAVDLIYGAVPYINEIQKESLKKRYLETDIEGDGE